MAPLTIRQATKSYGAHDVLHAVDVQIEDGEFVVLVGPSGCGKSTLLRSISGLEDLTSGDILIDGKVVTDLHPKDRDIAMVFQSYALYPHMTVAENMGFSLRMRGKGNVDERDSKVRNAAEILDLVPLLDRYPRQLSGGQRQRVAMGRAIVRDPKVFLFDEPLSNLDAKLRVQMRSEIRVLHKKLGTTIVYVTHDQIEAMTMADRIVIMRDGRVEQVGTPVDLYDRPSNIFVAGFIGSPAMNLIEGSVTADGMALITDSGTQIPLQGGLSAFSGRPITLGLRPEDIGLAQESEGQIKAKIETAETTGAELHVVLDAGGVKLTAVFHGRPGLVDGQTVHLTFEREKLHLFDRETGKRTGD